MNVKKAMDDMGYCRVIVTNYANKGVLRKCDPEIHERYMQKSVHNLDFANYLMEENDKIMKKLDMTVYEWCMVVYYYALYHSALALLSKAGYESKGHTATIAAIILIYYHKEKTLTRDDIQLIASNLGIDRDDISFISDSKDMRERASYGIGGGFESELAARTRGRTVKFIQKVREVLKE
jgi:uncharacterized protein (UPF0332 family)